ncbi:MAG: exonuclease subunit SbcD [Thiotrichaceae bacterium]|nr:exonuclease subunit SbcD [Thiotrichaceae bacterium]
MRILHTSDWHLGQNFMGKSRAPEHQAFLAWILKQIEIHQVDVLIVAGDIFDTGTPPSNAREIYNRFIVDIQSKQCELIILGGNHDSVATLNESKDLLACLNTRVVSGVSDNHEAHVFALKNRSAEVAGILCAIPFIRPRDVLRSKAGQSSEEKQQAIQQAIRNYYHTLYAEAKKLRDNYSQDIPIIATGHLTTVGASTSESVRDIYIGSLEAFPAKDFPPADYIALGHIHQSQLVAKSEHIRYSGSPIALSFDETRQKKAKSILLVTFERGKFSQATPLEVPCFQAMRVIKGNLKSIKEQLSSLLDDYQLKEGKTLWLEIIISAQEGYLDDLHHRLQEITADFPVEILRLRREQSHQQASLHIEEKETLNELSVEDVFERRLSEESWETQEDKQRVERLTVLFKQVVNELSEDDK